MTLEQYLINKIKSGTELTNLETEICEKLCKSQDEYDFYKGNLDYFSDRAEHVDQMTKSQYVEAMAETDLQMFLLVEAKPDIDFTKGELKSVYDSYKMNRQKRTEK